MTHDQRVKVLGDISQRLKLKGAKTREIQRTLIDRLKKRHGAYAIGEGFPIELEDFRLDQKLRMDPVLAATEDRLLSHPIYPRRGSAEWFQREERNDKIKWLLKKAKARTLTKEEYLELAQRVMEKGKFERIKREIGRTHSGN